MSKESWPGRQLDFLEELEAAGSHQEAEEKKKLGKKKPGKTKSGEKSPGPKAVERGEVDDPWQELSDSHRPENIEKYKQRKDGE